MSFSKLDFVEVVPYLFIIVFYFQSNWINKERVLIFASRGISHRDRHLMLDLRKMMPHSKSGKILFREADCIYINF